MQLQEDVVAVEDLGHPKRTTRPVGELDEDQLGIRPEAHDRQCVDHGDEQASIGIDDRMIEDLFGSEIVTAEDHSVNGEQR